MKLIFVPIILCTVALLALSDARADATPEIVATPTVDGYPTLASIPMPDNQRIFLTESPYQCTTGYYYGMLANVDGTAPTWFCWHLDTQRGVIRSDADDYAVAVEDFNWTGPGRAFLKRQVNL